MRRYISAKSSSATVSSVLYYVYRKEDLFSQCGRYGEAVIKGLEELGLIKKVLSKKGTFYFKTDKSKDFKAVDFAKEYLWNFHNSIDRKITNGKKYILCFNKNIEAGHKLVEIDEAIKKCYV
ncbi:hypothetical protein [Sulfurimonas sp.]|uniref:hypothetical protein n=1 Tax=Sulfurimonas sp. TaxID=2022749 RepID=UPI0025F6488B|nr:hypothetical protein [Sulfurimonas sp.]